MKPLSEELKRKWGPLFYVFWQFVESCIKMKWLWEQMWTVWQEQLRLARQPVYNKENGMQGSAGCRCQCLQSAKLRHSEDNLGLHSLHSAQSGGEQMVGKFHPPRGWSNNLLRKEFRFGYLCWCGVWCGVVGDVCIPGTYAVVVV